MCVDLQVQALTPMLDSSLVGQSKDHGRRGSRIFCRGGSTTAANGGSSGGSPPDNCGILEGRRRDFPASQHQTERR